MLLPRLAVLAFDLPVLAAGIACRVVTAVLRLLAVRPGGRSI